MKIAALQADPKNANRGTDRGRKALAHSLEEFGAGRSILIDKKGRVIAGNKTLEQAKAAGHKDVLVVKTDGSQLVAVQRTDLDLLDTKARALAIADNRVGELNLEWDADALTELMKDVDLSQFWDKKELELMLGSHSSEAPEPQIDQAEELQAKWKVKLGQLWLVGEHRLLCGDSTKKEDVARLWENVAQDALPVLMVTDPPYGVEYDPNWRNEAERPDGTPYGASAIGEVSNDDRMDWKEAWDLFPGDVAYVWHAGRYASEVAVSLLVSGLEIRSQIIWAKTRFVISRGHYHWQHEPCWYAVRKGKTGHWIGDRSQTTVWTIEHMASDTGHGTQKPIECMMRPIRNHEGNVYDPFLGSGTTMCAAELSDRICYGLELEPRYCSVILERLSAMGLTPKLAKRNAA